MTRGTGGSIPSLLERSYIITKSLEELNIKTQDWFQDYLRQTYTLVFETTVPKGRTNEEKILYLAKIIFPELRAKYLRSLPSSEKSKTDVLKKSLPVDMAINTVKGYFFIKDFRDKVVKNMM